MKCLQCGEELNGNKFCTNCGTPAPQEATGEVQSNNAVDNTASEASQPVDYSDPYAENNAQPVDYSNPYAQNTYQQNNGMPSQSQGFTGQQFTNNANGIYAGQQFTNQPNTAHNGKKPMSSGKIAVIVISIVVGLMIILGIIVGIVACNTVKSVMDVAKDGMSIYGDNFSSAVSDFDSYLDSYDSYEYVEDEKTGLVFEESDDYDGWAVVDYNSPDYDISKITLEIPEKFQGKEVVEIDRLYIYDNDYTDEGYIKIIIPGTVKVIDDYSVSYLEDINEVVIKDGVETIEDGAFKGDTDLTKIHIPASVTDIDEDCGIGYDDYDEPIKDFTLYCAKGSAAEKYAKDHKLNYEIEK